LPAAAPDPIIAGWKREWRGVESDIGLDVAMITGLIGALIILGTRLAH
jgi:hypothetical protein